MVDASGKEKGNAEKGVRVCSGSFLDLHEQPFSIPTPLLLLLIPTCASMNCVCTCIKDVPGTKLSSNFFKERTTKKETEISDLHSNHPIIRILFI